MRIFAGLTLRQFAYSILAFIIAVAVSVWMTVRASADAAQPLTDGQLLTRLVAIPAAFATLTFGVTMALTGRPVHAAAAPVTKPNAAPTRPYMAQVVGLQWLNPLERMDYPTEWQLLWTLGLVKPNPGDDMVKMKPQKYSNLQAIAIIADGNDGRETFEGFHEKYVDKLMFLFREALNNSLSRAKVMPITG